MSESVDRADAGESDGATASAASEGIDPADLVDGDSDDSTDLRARADLLAAENRRLREEYDRARRTEYRRAAVGLAGVGLVSVVAAVAFPAVREVLLVLGGIGLFGGILTRYLTPERFVAADVGERVYAALADNEAAIAAELGLQDTRVYVPVKGAAPARLFVPERETYSLPDGDALESAFVVTDDDAERGLGLKPTGAALYREFERTAAATPGDDPRRLAETLAEALVETFEIADAADADIDRADGRATVRVTGGAFSDGDRFDDPAASLVAVGLAVGLDAPVTAETASVADGYAVTCRWEADDVKQSSEADNSEDSSQDGTAASDMESAASEPR